MFLITENGKIEECNKTVLRNWVFKTGKNYKVHCLFFLTCFLLFQACYCSNRPIEVTVPPSTLSLSLHMTWKYNFYKFLFPLEGSRVFFNFQFQYISYFIMTGMLMHFLRRYTVTDYIYSSAIIKISTVILLLGDRENCHLYDHYQCKTCLVKTYWRTLNWQVYN